MTNDIVMTGVRPSLRPETRRARIERFAEMQNDHRCFLLIADCEAASAGEIAGGELEPAVMETVGYAASLGVDFERSLCFLQSQVPQLAELSRLLEGRFGSGVDALACNAVRDRGFGEVADMLMFRPTVVIGGKADRADFEVASTIVRTFGNGRFGQAVFEVVEEPETTPDTESSAPVSVRDVLNFGAAAARIEAQRTLEVVREEVGLDYLMFR